MKITNHWVTPIAEFDLALPQPMRQQLTAVLQRKEADRDKLSESSPDFFRFMQSKQFYASTHYNLFAEANQHPEKNAILSFEMLACNAYRQYLRQALNIEQADELKLVGRCFGNVQTTGGRTFPHYHQSVDHVLIHYLDIPDHNDPELGKSYRHGTHALLLQDPRGAVNYPYWEKVLSIAPYTGKTIIHPAYVWHESNPYRGQGTRICLVVNFQIASHSYIELHKEMRF